MAVEYKRRETSHVLSPIDFGIHGETWAVVVGGLNSRFRKESGRSALPILSETLTGTHPETSLPISLTLYHPSQATFAQKEAQYMMELTELSPKFLGYGIIDGMPVVMSEQVTPITHAYLSDKNKIQAIEFAADILDLLHEKGKIHHNINPESIVICYRPEGRQVCLRHFELATRNSQSCSQQIEENNSVRNILLANLTRNEQSYASSDISFTDQYFLAKTAYHLLGGREDYPIIKPNSISFEVWGVIRKGMKPNPSHRYSNCTEFAAKFSEAFTSLS